MNGMQAAGAKPGVDRVLVEAGCPQLRNRDDSELPLGDFRQCSIPVGALVAYIAT